MRSRPLHWLDLARCRVLQLSQFNTMASGSNGATMLKQLENYIIVDVGANLTNKKFSRDLDSVVQRAKDAGIYHSCHLHVVNVIHYDGVAQSKACVNVVTKRMPNK